MANPSMTQTSLRTIPLLTSPLWFSLLLAHGIVAGNPLPVIGIVPLSISAISGAAVLVQQRLKAKHNSFGMGEEKKVNVLLLQLDLVIAALQMFMLIPFWVGMARYRWHSPGLIMLATYGSAFMMADFAIHICLAGIQLLPIVLHPVMKAFGATLCNCPSCPSHSHNTGTRAVGIGAEYSLLAADAPDAEAVRDSIDVQSENGELLGRSGGVLKI